MALLHFLFKVLLKALGDPLRVGVRPCFLIYLCIFVSHSASCSYKSLNKSSLIRSYLRLSGCQNGNQTNSVKNLITFSVGNLGKVKPLSRLLINCLLSYGQHSRTGFNRTSTARMCHISGSSRSYVGRLCSLSRQNLYYARI